MRSNAIVLSSRHYSIPQLINIFDIDRDTTSHSLDLWEIKGLVAVFDAPRSGRPPILTTEEVLHLAELLQTEPRQLKEVHTQLTLETVNKFSLKCLKDGLKNLILRMNDVVVP